MDDRVTTQPTQHGAMAPRQHRRVIAAMEIAVVILAAYLLVKLFYTIITPVTLPSPQAFGAQADSDQAKPAGSLETVVSFDPFFRKSATVTERETSAPESKLKIIVAGTRANSERSGEGTAIINAQDGEQKFIKIGDEVSRGIRLVAVYGDRIEISRSGLRETIYMKKPAQQSGQGRSVVRQAEQSRAGNASSNNWVQQLLTKIPFEPARNDGRLVGFRIGESSERDILQNLGLEVGDVVRSVAGSPLTSFERLSELEDEIGLSETVVMEVERRGEILSVTVGG